jgi:hypothetical protein
LKKEPTVSNDRRGRLNNASGFYWMGAAAMMARQIAARGRLRAGAPRALGEGLPMAPALPLRRSGEFGKSPFNGQHAKWA